MIKILPLNQTTCSVYVRHSKDGTRTVTVWSKTRERTYSIKGDYTDEKLIEIALKRFQNEFKNDENKCKYERRRMGPLRSVRPGYYELVDQQPQIDMSHYESFKTLS